MTEIDSKSIPKTAIAPQQKHFDIEYKYDDETEVLKTTFSFNINDY